MLRSKTTGCCSVFCLGSGFSYDILHLFHFYLNLRFLFFLISFLTGEKIFYVKFLNLKQKRFLYWRTIIYVLLKRKKNPSRMRYIFSGNVKSFTLKECFYRLRIEPWTHSNIPMQKIAWFNNCLTLGSRPRTGWSLSLLFNQFIFLSKLNTV